MKEALFYITLPDKVVRCNLCAHRCIIPEGKKGICRVRENRGGILNTLVYGKLIAAHADPIEKKPLYHFYPGSSSYSIATPGCNFQCRWCQNFEISQLPRMTNTFSPGITSADEVVNDAIQSRSQSISYTYTEPTIFFEYANDIARLAKGKGLKNVFVSNGYMTHELLDFFHPYLDAINVDLKSMSEDVYHRYIGAKLQPVLDNLVHLKKQGVWIEVTTLVIPGVNDKMEEMKGIASFILNELGKETPWHISRFFPNYQMQDTPPTDVQLLQSARETGLAQGLENVYMGNVGEETNTFCPICKKPVIRRQGYWIVENNVRNGKCRFCENPIAGVGLG